ncbi:MAG: ACT domain-containing protein [Planctomycetaceae bacterium]|jgi:glycine cleavage system transcriptional repressor
MPNEFVLTMTAANRSGILSAVTRAMAELDGDLRELSQTVVRGYFTMIFSAEFPDELSEDVVRAHVEDTCRPFGIDVALKNPKQDGLPSQSVDLPDVHILRMGGDNHSGVLRELSTVISMYQADIVGMRAIRVDLSGGFELVMKVAVPRGFDVAPLLTALGEAGREYNITVDAPGSA